MSLPRVGSLLARAAATRHGRLMTAGLLGVAFGLLNFILDHSVISSSISDDAHSLIEAGTMGVIAGALVLVILLGYNSRRMMIASELQRVAELNHVLRNSLQIIISSHYLQDEPHSQQIIESAEEIARKLKELFPAVRAGGQSQSGVEDSFLSKSQ